MDPAHKWDTNHRRELLTSMNLEATLNAILGSEGSMTVLPSISVEYGNPRMSTNTPTDAAPSATRPGRLIIITHHHALDVGSRTPLRQSGVLVFAP